jgi:hypothetical protein
MRRSGVFLAIVVLFGVGVLGGPASAKTAKIATCKKDKHLNANIAKALETYLNGANVTQQLAAVDSASKITSFVQQSDDAGANHGFFPVPQGQAQLTVGLNATCSGTKTATFTYDLSSPVTVPTRASVAGVGLSLSGDALLNPKQGKWSISAKTICGLIGINRFLPPVDSVGSKCLAAAS